MTLRKLDIKVETVNREPLTMHSDREDDTASVSTATRVMKAIYSVRVLLLPGPLLSLCSWDWPLCRLTLVLTHTRTHVHTHKCSCAHTGRFACAHTFEHTSRRVSFQQRIGRLGPLEVSFTPSFSHSVKIGNSKSFLVQLPHC